MLRFKNLGSGSTGNATVVEGRSGSQVRRLLIDCGLGIRQLQARFIGHNVPAAERFEFARFAVDRNADVYLTLIPFLRGLRQREFEGAEDDIFIDVFFARQRVNQ